MTAHLHDKFVPGCYRCELGRDEEVHAILELRRIEDAARELVAAEDAFMADRFSSSPDLRCRLDNAWVELRRACE